MILYYMVFALLMMALARFTDKDILRIQLGSVTNFIGFLFIVVAFRICLTSLFKEFGIDMHSHIYKMAPIWTVGLVWWEDAFFALPIYFLYKYVQDTKYLKLIKILIVIALSTFFASGHMYQGWMAVVVTFFYPYFMSYKYGKKVGFGTVMVCHILFDVVSRLTIKLMPYLI